jgi:hypothetical protein
VPGQRLADRVVEVELLKESRQIVDDNVLELPHTRAHQVGHDVPGFPSVDAQEILEDQDEIMHLTLE